MISRQSCDVYPPTAESVMIGAAMNSITGKEKSVAYIRLDSLSKTFKEGGNERTVLDRASAQFKRGEFVAVVGKSGTGKSTLLNIISGIDRADAGSVWVDGQELTALDDHACTLFRRNHIGFIFQFYNLIPTLTVWENVVLPLELAGLDARRIRSQAEPLLEAVGPRGPAQEFP